jgi:hypothetical protein
MSNENAPFGLRAIGKVGQNRDNQGLSEYSIAANNTITIFFQDAVKAMASGTIQHADAGDVLLGSLNGVFYTDPTTSKPTFANHYAQVNASDISAFVSDDPYERFEIQTDISTASQQTDVFMNADIVVQAGNSANNVSQTMLDDNTLATANGQLKIIAPSTNIDNSTIGAGYLNWVVMINEHQYNAAVAGV